MLSIGAGSVELNRNEVWSGFKQLLPISMFVMVFAIAFGLAAAQSGLGEASTLLMSILVFAGAAQFAVLDLGDSTFRWFP